MMGANCFRSNDHSTPKATLCTAESKEVGPPIPMERKCKRSNQRQKKQNTYLYENGSRITHDFTLVKDSSKKSSQKVQPNCKVSREVRDSKTITRNCDEVVDGGYATIDDVLSGDQGVPVEGTYLEILPLNLRHSHPTSYTWYMGPDHIYDEACVGKSGEEENAEDLKLYYNGSEYQQSQDDSYDNSWSSHQGTIATSTSTTDEEDSSEPTHNSMQTSSGDSGMHSVSTFADCLSTKTNIPSIAEGDVCPSDTIQLNPQNFKVLHRNSQRSAQRRRHSQHRVSKVKKRSSSRSHQSTQSSPEWTSSQSNDVEYDEVCDSRAEGAQAMTALAVSARGYFGSNQCNPTEEAEAVECTDVPTHRQSSTDAVRDKDRTSVVDDCHKRDAIKTPQFTKLNEELQHFCQRRSSGSIGKQTDCTDIDEPSNSSNHSTYDTLNSASRMSHRSSSTNGDRDVTDFSLQHSGEITFPGSTDHISQRPTSVQSISTTDGDVLVQDDTKEQFTSDSAYVRACQTFDLRIRDKMQHRSFTPKKELLQIIEEAALESKRQFAMDCVFETDKISQTSLSACYKDMLEGHIKTQTKIIKTKYEAEKQKENEDKTSEINKLKEQVMMLQNRLNNSGGPVFV